LVAAEAGLDNIVAALLIAGTDPNGVHAVCNVKEIYLIKLWEEQCLTVIQ